MNRTITNHWTAGTNKHNSVDLEHYHYIIDGDGSVYRGDHSISANDNTADGDYAAHTGGGNTANIGVSVSGMAGYSSPKKIGRYPLTKVQLEKLFEVNAILAFNEGYKKITYPLLQTHKEFGDAHPKTSSYGKIDITYLPPYPEIKSEEVANFIRNKTQVYLDRIIKGTLKPIIITKN